MVIVYILLPEAPFSLESGQESSLGFGCMVVHMQGTCSWMAGIHLNVNSDFP